MKLYVVKYSGPFGFIKPWTAVRDELTQSQQFLSPSTLMGISKKLFGLDSGDRIKRYRLFYYQMDEQQEQTLPKELKTSKKKDGTFTLSGTGILTRIIMVAPTLYLAFESEKEAEESYSQHICLCRNEDLLFPDASYGIQSMEEEEFEAIPGFELYYDRNNPTDPSKGFPAGRHRYLEGHPQTYGELIHREEA